MYKNEHQICSTGSHLSINAVVSPKPRETIPIQIFLVSGFGF
jgi:hypothetical protein